MYSFSKENEVLKYLQDTSVVIQHAARVGERRNMYRFLVGKPEGKRPL
jgi:hypothetical protein